MERTVVRVTNEEVQTLGGQRLFGYRKTFTWSNII